ncbi:zinc ABC transporter substrate-binding protein [Bacteroidia bacterium]|nr:zinc ABC transporter substrate-binding protein [Bacteroidia bacterium]
MNKRIIFGFWMMLCLFSCTEKPQQEKIITVTIEPQRYFTEELADTLFQVITMVPPGSSPETYDPTPQQMVQLSKSKAYFCIGHIGYENAWLDRLKQNNPHTRFFDNSEGIQYILSGHHHEGHTHSGQNIDPHTWISPKEAFILAENICRALTELDPAHAEIFRLNGEKLKEKIRQTDQEVEAYLNRSTQKAFIIYHPALSYFARDYGLKQYAIEADGKEPSPEQIRKIIETAKTENIRTVFIQQEFDRKNAEIVAKETGCKLVVINPLSYHWEEEIIQIAKALADE